MGTSRPQSAKALALNTRWLPVKAGMQWRTAAMRASGQRIARRYPQKRTARCQYRHELASGTIVVEHDPVATAWPDRRLLLGELPDQRDDLER